MVLPIASVYSTRPPVSVLVRAPTFLPRGFSRKHGLAGFAIRLVSRLGLLWSAGFHADRPTRFHGDVQNPARLPFSVAPSVIAARRRYGNIDPLRIGYASRPRLSSRLTLGGLASPRKPWTYGGGVSHASLVTHASIRASGRSTGGRPACFEPYGTLPYRRRATHGAPARRFGAVLSPVNCRRMSTRLVSCYALFEWVAASKPTS